MKSNIPLLREKGIFGPETIAVNIQNVYNYAIENGKFPQAFYENEMPLTSPWPFAAFELAHDDIGSIVIHTMTAPREEAPQDIIFPDEPYPLSTPQIMAELPFRTAHVAMSRLYYIKNRVPGESVLFLAICFHFLDDTGRSFLSFVNRAPEELPFAYKWDLEEWKREAEEYVAFFQLASFACAFTHCKNVTSVEHRPPPKVAAKRRKAGKPTHTYRTIVIDPTQEQKHSGRSGTTGSQKSLHICRGHFAHYTPEKPLFGKLVGTYSRPMHARGNRQHGRVTKDYSVTANHRHSP